MTKSSIELYTKKRFGLGLYEFMREKVEKEALCDYEIAEILGVRRGRIGVLRRTLGIDRPNWFSKRFERKYGRDAVVLFKNMIEHPEKSLADVGNCFGFSREYARQVHRKIYGFPYTIAYRRKRDQREKKRAKCEKTEHLMQAFDVLNVSDRDRLPTQRSTQQIIEQKFRGLRGINCRFAFGAISPVSIEIDQIIAHRVTGAAGASPRT